MSQELMSQELINSINNGLYIDGEWRQASDLKTFDVFDPASEECIGSVADADAVDAIAAVDAAHRAGPGWAATAPRQRAEILRKAFDLMVERKSEFATVISREEGKTFQEGLAEVAYASEFFRWFSEEAVRDRGRLGLSPTGANRIMVRHQPVGVCLLITPWNHPAAMATRKIAPALAAGCSLILKPASETPFTAAMVVNLLADAGVPPGVVNLLPTKRASLISNTILEDQRVTKLSFTGSTEVGRHLLAKAAERVVNCSMELGGTAPFIVLEDADMQVALDAAIVAKMRNAGESCIGANSFFVHRSRYDEFCEGFSDRMRKLKIGSGLEDGIEVGPLINAGARDEVERLVNEAVQMGAQVLTGGKRWGEKGFFFEPTVLSDVPIDAQIVRTEIFGPVAPVVVFDDVDEVLADANKSIFGLAAYVMGKDVGKALAVAERLDAGIMGINRGFVSDPAAPFGGFRQSGLGREGSYEGIGEFLETKYMAVDW